MADDILPGEVAVFLSKLAEVNQLSVDILIDLEKQHEV